MQENKKNDVAICDIVFGEPGGIRTPDPRLRRALLYPAELLTHNLNAISIIMRKL